MRELLKQINDIQQQLNELQANVISILPVMEFASELFCEQHLSAEEQLSEIPAATAASEKAENLVKKTRKILKPKAEPVATPEPKAEPVATPEPKAEPVATPEPKAEPVATPEPKAEPVPVPEPVAAPEPKKITYDDFKDAIYSFIKENTAVNKPIVLGIFKDRGYGFTSDVPEADYQLVLNIIRPSGE